MKKLLLLFSIFCLTQTWGQSQNLHVEHDTMYGEFTVVENSIEHKNHIINAGTQTVKIRWTRTVVDITPGWATNFCDKNVCWLGSAASKTFDLFPADTGLLKPIFYANSIEGCIVYRLDMVSETPGIAYQKSLLFLARTTNGCQVLGAEDIEEVKDFAVYPNPVAAGTLNVVFVDVNFSGKLDILDAQGRVVFQKNQATANEGLDIATLPVGAYSVRATDSTGRILAVRQFSKI